MIRLQDMLDIESTPDRKIEYDVEVETNSGKRGIFTVKLSDFGHEEEIQMQLTRYVESGEREYEFALFKNGISLKVSDIVYIKVNEGSDLPF